jgi:hypothetical protein
MLAGQVVEHVENWDAPAVVYSFLYLFAKNRKKSKFKIALLLLFIKSHVIVK